MADIPLPAEDALRDLLADLLSKSCVVDATTDPLGLAPAAPALIAEYVDPDGEVAGAAIGDLSFACRAGSALVMMSADDAQEALNAGAIEGDMLDCYKEVTNVLARLLNSGDTPHVKLRGLFHSGQLLPGGVRTLLNGATRRRDFSISIEEYGEGRLSVVSRADAAQAAAA